MKLIVLIFILVSCAGYSFKEKTNPFSQFGIRSISVPMFYNHTNFPALSGSFTREIFHTLTDFKDLMIYSGLKRTDAVLIGIIESPEKKRDSVVTTARKSTESIFGENILGDKREDLLVPTSSELRLNLRLIVIKHPTQQEINFLQRQGTKGAINSKIIFNEVVPLKSSYNHKELKAQGIAVLGSQNRGLRRDTLEAMAEEASNSFKDMILYAF